MNKVFLVGNLTRDPELSTVGATGASVCKFGIAVNRRAGGNQETDFYNITAWRALGENCAKFIKNGSKVAISGDIQIRNYEDKEGKGGQLSRAWKQDAEAIQGVYIQYR